MYWPVKVSPVTDTTFSNNPGHFHTLPSYTFAIDGQFFLDISMKWASLVNWLTTTNIVIYMTLPCWYSTRIMVPHLSECWYYCILNRSDHLAATSRSQWTSPQLAVCFPELSVPNNFNIPTGIQRPLKSPWIPCVFFHIATTYSSSYCSTSQYNSPLMARALRVRFRWELVTLWQRSGACHLPRLMRQLVIKCKIQ